MDIPVFVSCPTSLSPQQNNARGTILDYLNQYKLEPRSLGRSDYPTELPLREVLVIAKHCAGGIILGFEQYRSLDGIDKPGTGGRGAPGIERPLPDPLEPAGGRDTLRPGPAAADLPRARDIGRHL
jgi:hypothetical protein